MRKHRTNNNETGLTSFDNFIPTMTLAGSKDGLYRCTRAGEGYWHGVQNIEPREKGNFPVAVVLGGSHGSFMDEDILPSTVAILNQKSLKQKLTTTWQKRWSISLNLLMMKAKILTKLMMNLLFSSNQLLILLSWKVPITLEFHATISPLLTQTGQKHAKEGTCGLLKHLN